MSTNQNDCYKNIIGLSRTECECFDTTGAPADYNISASGLYLDELRGLSLKLVGEAAGCENGSIWDILSKARESAITRFKMDLLACIRTKSTLKRRPHKGLINQYDKATTPYNLNKSNVGTKWEFDNIVGGFVKIKRIGIFVNFTTTVDLGLYKDYNPSPEKVITLETAAGQLQWNDLPEPIVLEMASRGGPHVEYQWLYTPEASMAAYNVGIHCGCGSGFKPSWDLYHPQYNNRMDRDGKNWADWMQAIGIEGNNLSEMKKFSERTYTAGLVFDVEIGCRSESTLCDEELDYETNELAAVQAHAINNLAGHLAVETIRSMPDPNIYTMIDGERLLELSRAYLKEYKAMTLDFLCPEITRPENINATGDCYSCQDTWGFVKSPMLITG